MSTETNTTVEPTEGDRKQVFVDTPRGWAAVAAAGQAVAAVLLGQQIAEVGVFEGEEEDDWEPRVTWEEDVSEETVIMVMLSRPMARYACGLREYGSDAVQPGHYWYVIEAISNWPDCPLFDRAGGQDELDPLYQMEVMAIFELYKVRTLRFLREPQCVSTILALAHAFLSSSRVTAEEATALIKKHLASQ